MLQFAALLVLGVAPSFVAAQKATCLAGFNWMFSSTGENPCDIAADLAGVCVGGQFTLQALDVGFVYLGPAAANANSCRCSTVYYSLLSACATCQDRDFIRWSAYNPNCTTVYSQVFIQTIPIGTKVPHYAYLDVATTDTFNATLAQAAGGVESTRPPTASATSSSASASNTSSSNSSGGTSTSKKSNAGAIAGGVVGGIVGLLLIAGLVFWLLRRRKARTAAPSTNYDGTPAPPPPMGYTGGTLTPNYTGATGKVYDPNDPTTFPAMNTTGTTAYSPYSDMQHQPSYPDMHHPSPFSAPQNLTPNYTGNSQPGMHAQQFQPARPQYTGAPEL